MPQTKQAKKALKKSEKRAATNKLVKSTIKTLVKKSKQGIAKKDGNVETTIKETIKRIDAAIQKGIIKKNTGARKKSRIAKGLNDLEAKGGKKVVDSTEKEVEKEA